MFKNIIKSTNCKAFSKLVVLHPLFTCKPLEFLVLREESTYVFPIHIYERYSYFVNICAKFVHIMVGNSFITTVPLVCKYSN